MVETGFHGAKNTIASDCSRRIRIVARCTRVSEVGGNDCRMKDGRNRDDSSKFLWEKENFQRDEVAYGPQTWTLTTKLTENCNTKRSIEAGVTERNSRQRKEILRENCRLQRGFTGREQNL